MSPRASAAPPLLEVRVGAARVWCSGRPHGNIGDHVGDDPRVVAANRAALAELAGGRPPGEWVWIRQVHGVEVFVATNPVGKSAGSPAPVADAAVTVVAGLALAIVTADCAPLVVASDRAVGVVHAGHRGLAGGVIEATIERVRELGAGEVRAFLGPCIRAGHYEFAPADLEPFVAKFGPGVEGRTRAGRPALDIPAAIRIVLDRVGVASFVDSGLCTADSDAFFSYRRDGRTGRQATVAMLS